MNNQMSFLSSSRKAVAALLFPAFIFAGCGGDSSSTNYNPRNPNGEGPAPVNLTSVGGDGSPTDMTSASSYVVLSKTGVSNSPTSVITGNIGVSPAAGSYLTGFSLTMDSTNVFSTAGEVTGKLYAADYAVPTPSNLTTAIGAMETAYTDAASRTPPDFNELMTGNIGGLTLTPGLYTWTNTVLIPTDVTLNGGPNDVWIFQVAGDVTMSSATQVILSGGALAKNVYWQVAGRVSIGTTAQFKGIILAKTAIVLQTGSRLDGRALSQTAVTISSSTVAQP